ncbi:alpha- and gamma-adaptin-binding protein p34-like [Chrysoperla carnea]|uniref:alpha- and gamma-adaptin-binding protein p34-like n=1 Tax=Chrysoperla carnea TaxID=189513 RepID=UPI001D083429|nr:alpha- and gamma-adaptin-binding protein p34-like [Chrysoperla carnea]
MVENNPRILVIGLDKNPTDLIKRIIGSNTEPLADDIEEYPWQIKNKYYTANVHLFGLKLKCSEVVEDTIYDNVEAVIVFFDSQQENAVNGLSSLENYLKNYDDVEVKLIICDKFSVNSSEHNKVTDWCSVNHYQYIDLEFDETKIDDADSDYDNFINDTHGIDRIIEDLQVHIWSNAEMIGKNTSKYKEDEFGEKELDEFCELYSQLSAIAGGISSLPRDQRLQSAEQVVKQFWNAISGDDGEFSDDDIDLGVTST